MDTVPQSQDKDAVPPQSPDRLSEQFQKVLNVNGYGFQNAILRRLDTLSRDHRSSWRLVGPEFPVVAGGESTHIDFVLQQGNRVATTYLVAECKRVDPKFGRWCFARSPYPARNLRRLVFDQFECDPGPPNSVRQVHADNPATDGNSPYHVSFEMKTNLES